MNEYISPLLADIIGLLGSFLCICAFAYSNISNDMNKIWFNVMNLLGAIFLMISLTVNFNLPSMVLEIVWMSIAVFGLMKIFIQYKMSHKQKADNPS